jgi:cytochrome c oxidase assembly factor CtaG
LAIVLFVLLSFSFGHCVICPFPLVIVLFVQITQWQKKKDNRTNNTMAKEKGQKDK